MAVFDPSWKRYNHFQVVNVIGEKVIALGFAGKMSILDKASCLPVPIHPEVKAGEKALVKASSSYRESTIERVDAGIGRVFTDKGDAVAFGDVMKLNPKG